MATPTAPASPGLSDQGDQLVLVLARFVQALHDRYPEGPDQMHREALDARANIRRMRTRKDETK
jgi:hypothetical protein